MRVFLITTSSFPYGMADTKRIMCYARALLYVGVECEVVVYKRNSGFNNTLSDGVEDGVPYHYVGSSPIRHRRGVYARALDIFDRCRLFCYLRKKVKKSDVVFCYGSLYSSFLIDYLHSKGALFVANLTEYPFLSSGNSLFQKYYRWILINRLFPRYDGVISISDTLVSFAKEHTAPLCKHLKVPILVDFESYNLEDMSNIPSSNERFIFHAGSLVESKDGILGMIEAFGKYINLHHSDLLFISTGLSENSPHHAEIQALIDHYHLKNNVRFTGYLNAEEYSEYLKKASLVIINKNVSLQNHYCFSTKLGEYMAAGKCIIMTSVGEAINWVQDEKDVFVVPPQDSDLLAEKIHYVMSRPALRVRVSGQAKETCHKCFDYKRWGKMMADFLLSC